MADRRRAALALGAAAVRGQRLGDVLHSFCGYSDALTVLQALTDLGYLGVVLPAHLGSGGSRRRSPGTELPAR